jgi:hypothetical protein
MTLFGVYTPTRVLMGQTDTAAYCQPAALQIFGKLIFSRSAKTMTELFDLFDQVLSTCVQFGLKLSKKMYQFFLREAGFCGKVISTEGITHSPSRIQGNVDLAPPKLPTCSSSPARPTGCAPPYRIIIGSLQKSYHMRY